MFNIQSKRYSIDGSALKAARQRRRLTQAEFASKCGWSPTYQWKLENGRIDSIQEETKNVIEDVLKHSKF